MESFNKIIKEIASELDIKVTLLSDNWLTVLEKNNKIKYIQGYKFPLNDHAIGNILDDKGLFYDLMKLKEFPIIYHKVIFKNYDHDDILKFFNDNNQEIVVKGNIGTCGSEVFLVNNIDDLFPTIDNLLDKQFSISLCPYYDIINEYRVILLNNEARIVYGKQRPIVIGDGMTSLHDLLIKFNPYYYQNPNHLKDIINYIPELNEKVTINWQFNLSKGATLFTDISEELKKEITKLAQDITKTLNITFASVDIIKTTDNKLLVMEANSGVMMKSLVNLIPNGYDLAKNIYKDALNLMFQE